MAKAILDLLDSLAKRPQMYVYPVSFAMVQSYLRGLRAACQLAGIEYTWDDYFAAAQGRGWAREATSESNATSGARESRIR